MLIEVRFGDFEYGVTVERGAIRKAGEIFSLDRKVLIVTDDGVPLKYSESIARKCAFAKIFRLASGEASKNADSFLAIIKELLEGNFTRKDCIVAVGGGVVGDIAGFAASAYMRGIDFYNVPTTFLSQVDSSIGGKTAIDFNGVKNCIGAFYPPKAVLIDPDVLKTLDKRQLAAGIAESVKMAATFDEELFSLLETSDDFEKIAEEVIVRSLFIKKDVVEKDPKEKGLRKALNFGHTVGHAIESYEKGKMLHGECVAAGMTYACFGETRERLTAVLKKYGLPVETDAPAEELMKFIVHDKKATGDGIDFIVCDKIGTFSTEKVKTEEFKKILGRKL